MNNIYKLLISIGVSLVTVFLSAGLASKWSFLYSPRAYLVVVILTLLIWASLVIMSKVYSIIKTAPLARRACLFAMKWVFITALLSTAFYIVCPKYELMKGYHGKLPSPMMVFNKVTGTVRIYFKVKDYPLIIHNR